MQNISNSTKWHQQIDFEVFSIIGTPKSPSRGTVGTHGFKFLTQALAAAAVWTRKAPSGAEQNKNETLLDISPIQIAAQMNITETTAIFLSSSRSCFLEYALFWLYWKWNVSYLECALFAMFPFWNELDLGCALYGMCYFWNVLKIEWAFFGTCPFWNMLKIEWALIWIVYTFWNVHFMERS